MRPAVAFSAVRGAFRDPVNSLLTMIAKEFPVFAPV